ncbi:MAG: phospho-sugar mutase [Clostridia bacterium]|nr:phospho-sugar mutase [Clostridia bacterium]
MNYIEEYEKWLNSPVFDDKTKQELKSIKDEKEIEDRFYKNLSFGTGGLRGVIGAGTNRMNFYTVGKATQGLADFINSLDCEKKVVISYDSRNMSKEFALDTALIFAGNGIKAYLFETLNPTPVLSFAVRYLKTTAGVMITASHNPPEYNGYKVYWQDGGQIVPPYDKLIIDKVNAITDFSVIKRLDKESALKEGKLQYVGEEVLSAYIEKVKGEIVNNDEIKKASDNIKIVYTPLNGTGKVPVLRILNELGFKNVWVVPEQSEPDGNFPTLAYPNPEDPKAFDYALKLARKVDADIVMATDPDADRLGIYAKDKNGEYRSFSGNMSGLLIAEYLLSEKKKKNQLDNPKDFALVTTIVSSNMAKDVANEYGITLFETLTGFKYIGEKIKEFESAYEKCGKYSSKDGAYKFLFGFEESYGCLVGTHARDKDSVVAVALLSEIAAYCKNRDMTLFDRMQLLYDKYGFYKEVLLTCVLKGIDGQEKIKAIIEKLRNYKESTIGGQKIIAVRDYAVLTRKDLLTGKTEKLSLSKSDVLYFEFENNGWCCVRPSGTEPKIKFYIGIKGNTEKEVDEIIAKIEKDLNKYTE